MRNLSLPTSTNRYSSENMNIPNHAHPLFLRRKTVRDFVSNSILRSSRTFSSEREEMAYTQVLERGNTVVEDMKRNRGNRENHPAEKDGMVMTNKTTTGVKDTRQTIVATKKERVTHDGAWESIHSEGEREDETTDACFVWNNYGDMCVPVNSLQVSPQIQTHFSTRNLHGWNRGHKGRDALPIN